MEKLNKINRYELGESKTLGLREERIFIFLDKLTDKINELIDEIEKKPKKK